MKKRTLIVIVASLTMISTLPASGFELPKYSLGQIVYLPASYINISTTGQTTASRLVIRNIDQKKDIVIRSVKFLDPNGNLVKNLLDGYDCSNAPAGPTSVTLHPLQTTSFVTRSNTVCVLQYPLDAWWSGGPPDTLGGRPAWLVEWETTSGTWAVAPLVSATQDILTPKSTYIQGTAGAVIDAESVFSGTVLSEKRF